MTQPLWDELAISVARARLADARNWSDAITNVERALATLPAGHEDRERLAAYLQSCRGHLEDAVTANRASFKVIEGGKPWG